MVSTLIEVILLFKGKAVINENNQGIEINVLDQFRCLDKRRCTSSIGIKQKTLVLNLFIEENTVCMIITNVSSIRKMRRSKNTLQFLI